MLKKSFLLFMVSILLFTSCDDENPTPPIDPNSPITLNCGDALPTTWTDHNPEGIDYIVNCDLDISTDIIITPGTIIQVNNGFGILVESGGSLAAEGTSDAPISIKGQSSGSAATWSYLVFNSADVKNKLNHVNIENAGKNAGWNVNITETSAVFLEGKLSMTNTSISNSDGHGLAITEVLSESDLTDFSGNTFRNCTQYPICSPADDLKNMDLLSCTFTNNGRNFVRVYDEYSSERLQVESTWENAPVPYYVDSKLELYDNLTIEAGAELVFASGAGMETVSSQDSYLRINGTSVNHVIMRGEVATAGAWLGLYVTTTNVQTAFDYLDISDGGQEELSFSDMKGNITLEGEQARLTISNCTSTRAECDVVISTFFGGDYTFENNSPEVTSVCVD